MHGAGQHQLQQQAEKVRRCRGNCAQALDIAHASFHQKGAERQRWRGLVEAHSLLGLARHAAGDVHAALASADAAQALADHTDQRRNSLTQTQDASVPCALHRIAALRFATVRILVDAWFLACRGRSFASRACHSKRGHCI